MAENRVFLRAYEHRAPFAKRRLVLLLLVAFLIVPFMPSAFTPASAVGNLTRSFGNTGTGPTGGATVNSTGTLGSDPTVTSGYYNWTVPATGRYRIEATGAQGAIKWGYAPGYGATVTAEWNLVSGQLLKVYVGQQGTTGTNGGGGGGASGVFANSGSPATILAIAGGGGGSATNEVGKNASTTSAGVASSGAAGTAGDGGGKGFTGGDCGWAGGGGGYLTDGYGGNGTHDGGSPGTRGGTGAGKSYANGGAGSSSALCNDAVAGSGGFGAAGGGAGHYGGGGGGGYSGGGGGQYTGGAAGTRGGGGGGSYASGALSSSVVVSSQAGHGTVVLTLLAPAPTTFSTVTASPTNVSSLNYDVVFSENVSGLSTTDFTVTGTSSGWAVGSLTGTGSTYVLTVSSVSPTTGTVIVTMLQNSVLGATTNQLGPGADTSAATMAIDVDPPTASSGTTPSSPASAMSLTFGVNFSESVSGIAAGDFSNAGTAAGCVFTPSASSGTSVNVVVTQCQEGSLKLRLAAGGVVDAAGNTGPATSLDSSTITLAASALSVTAADKSINYGGSWTDGYTQSGLVSPDTITVTYSYSGTTTLGTIYGPSATKPTAGGTYSIIPSVSYGAGNANRYALTRNNGALTIARVTQSALTLTSTTATYGQTLSLTTSGGSGTGAVSYSVTSGTCTIAGTTLTPGDAGSVCTVTATKDADDNYTAVSSLATTVTVNRTAQATLTVTSTNATYGQTLSLTATGGSGGGSITWSVVSGTCTVSGSMLTPGNAGSSCIVRATKALDTNYNAVNSADTAITINRANQTALVVTTTNATYGSAYSLTTSGGSGAGAVTWSVVSGTCTVSGSTLTPGNAGSACVVRATKAQDTNYLVESSVDTTVAVARAAQAMLTVTSTSATYGSSYSLTTSGGSGTGAVSWQIMLGTCTVSGSSLNPGDAGSTCQVRATKAQDTNYLAEDSVTTTVNINRASQSALVVSTTNATYGSNYSLSTTGGSGSGSVSWAVISGTCTVSGSTLTPGNAGSACVVRATKAQDTNYNAVNSSNTTVTVGKANQTGLNITNSLSFTTGSTLALTASGGQTSGSLSWNVASGICSLTGTNLTANRGGVSCVVEVTRSGDSNYNASTVSETITVNKISQTLTFRSTPPSPANPGGSYTVSVDSDAFLAPVLSIANSSSSVCSISAGVVTFNATGTCLISAAQAGNDTIAPGAASQSVTVTAVAAAAPASTLPAVTVPIAPTASSSSSVAPPTTLLVKSAAIVTTTTTPPVATTSTTTPTTTTIPADPGQPQLGADGQPIELEAGETTAIVQGQKVKVSVKTDGDIVTIKLPNDVEVNIGSTDPTISSAKVSSDGVLRIFGGESVQVNANGLQADTTYTVFMFSDPVELGRGVAAKDGTVAEVVDIPKDAKAQSHTLQVNGVGPNGEVVTVSMGFDILKRQDNTRWAVIAISLGILLALLGGRPVFDRRRFRRS